ncbi:MAG: efflux transporter outer membrane subunit [Pirellulaceae bacterium]
MLAWLLCILAAAGCRTSREEYIQNGYKVGPNYSTPEAEVASQWIDYRDQRVSTAEPAGWDWWKVFNDPALDSLIRIASEQNLTMQEASFRILEARARRDMIAGYQLPQTQTLSGNMQNQQLSLAAGFPSGGLGGLPAGTPRQFNVWTSGPQVAWELDFWGRFRRAVESADADLGAAVGNFDHVLVILYSDVASAYVQIRIAEQRLQYAKSNVEFQKRSLELTQIREEEGKACTLDISQATTNLASTEALIPDLEVQLRQGQNRLCVLLGRPPTDIDSLVEESMQIPKVPPQVALGIPAELLRRRPDVRQAERELAAQSARIGIAESELYPALRINGAVFVQANQFNNLFTGSALAGSVGPSFSWNIFNYGRLGKGVDVEEAKYMQKAIHYQNTVLNANREAEDAMVTFLRAQDRARVLRKGVDAAIVSRNLTSDLYEAGKADFGRVFFAEYFLVLQQDELAQAEGAIALSLIDLYRALGGGWQAAPEEISVRPFEPADSEAEEVPPPASAVGNANAKAIGPQAAPYFGSTRHAEYAWRDPSSLMPATKLEPVDAVNARNEKSLTCRLPVPTSE